MKKQDLNMDIFDNADEETIDVLAKKYIKLSKKTGKTVIIKAGKKTGTYAICVMCNKYKKTFKIKVKK